MFRLLQALAVISVLEIPAYGARLSMSLETDGLPAAVTRLDIVWLMSLSDTADYDIDGFSFRFNVWYPPGDTGLLRVESVSTLPGWDTGASSGVGQPFTESFFFGGDDVTGEGISGNESEFSTVIGSVSLRAEGNVQGTEITFRHNNPEDPLPGAYDGPANWQLRWRFPVTGPFQFYIGVGSPGDAGWSGPSREPYQPVVIPPEPGSLALFALAGVAACWRRCRDRMPSSLC